MRVTEKNYLMNRIANIRRAKLDKVEISEADVNKILDEHTLKLDREAILKAISVKGQNRYGLERRIHDVIGLDSLISALDNADCLARRELDKKLGAEAQHIEDKIMLGDDSDVLAMLKDFESKEF